jgi:hypothetical protein
MWLERGMWVSCRRERGSISPNCNKLDFGGVVQLNFVAAINVAAINNDDSRQMPAMFLWYLPIAIQQLFRSATGWFKVFSCRLFICAYLERGLPTMIGGAARLRASAKHR